MILLIKKVNFSGNPLFLPNIFKNHLERRQSLEDFTMFLYIDNELDPQPIHLQHLDLSNTFLGIDIQNQLAFFQLLNLNLK